MKIQDLAKFSQNIMLSIGTRSQKRSNSPKMSYISRNYLVAQKVEQLEQNRKKRLKAFVQILSTPFIPPCIDVKYLRLLGALPTCLMMMVLTKF